MLNLAFNFISSHVGSCFMLFEWKYYFMVDELFGVYTEKIGVFSN